MDPNQNTGSFGAAIGGSDALKEAMQSRGMDTSILDQQSPASAGGAPSIPIPPTATNPSVGTPDAATAALTPIQAPPPDSEVMIATKALATVVTNDSKMKKDLVSLRGQGVV